jgi:Na+-driven multidrug efflux pump
VAYISSIIAIGSAIHGMGDYFNRFLGAHGQGKQLRNGAFVVGAVNILGYFILIKFFGIDGAAITKLAAGLIYCSMMIFYYFRFRKGHIISL